MRLEIILIWVHISPLLGEGRVEMLGNCIALMRGLGLGQHEKGSRHETATVNFGRFEY